MIKLVHVDFSYDGNAALNDITLTIKKGESVALMGPNGCGKSTLLKLLNGIISPVNGEYQFDGETITKKKMQDNRFSKRFHQRVGFIFQNPETQLFCSNVYDEVAFGPRQMGLDENAVKERVEDSLELLGIGGFQDRQPYHLSEGEKRKVAIASVLAMNPDVLTLDEPLNGLDPRSQRWLVEFLQRLNDAGKTVITSTHNLDLVQELSKRAILFDESHTIVADAPTAEILQDIDLLKKVNLVDIHYTYDIYDKRKNGFNDR